MTPQEEIQKGERAKALYEELLAPYFEDIDKQLYESFKAAREDELSLIRQQSRTVDGVKAHLMRFIETGKLARLEIEE